MRLRNQVQMITYPDSMGGSLSSLALLLNRFFSGLFGGIHVLPPFPSTGDRGFAPVTYFEVDPKFGSWEDVKALGESHDILVDLMVNHISRHSSYFEDFVRWGRKSEYADMFLTLEKIWPGGIPSEEDLSKIFLRRPEHCFADVKIESTGEVERVWATFGTRDWSEQIDLDVNSPITRDLFRRTFHFLSEQGVSTIRLDAIAFVIKKPGTSCFFVEPEIYRFLEWIKQAADDANLNLLLEVHAHHTLQSRLEQHGFWVYNFVLPALILHSLITHDGTALAGHLQDCPRHQITMLDCHDGIPVLPDMEDVLTVEEARRVVEQCQASGANISRIYSKDHRQGDFDAHQINCTYYSALDENDDAYIAARAIQFFAPGIPQVYYVGLLAGVNEPDEVQKVGDGRAINRHNFLQEEVEAQVQKPVVQRLLKLIRFRNEYAAFTGDFKVLDSDSHHLKLGWTNNSTQCTLFVDLKIFRSEITYLDGQGNLQIYYP
ncbi:MAG TPA: sucrose phosphorylase [Anaerolineaceae bacterium]|jgi:sucrose phosphorylase|nr:sucrose phosphorylase [Anaerolineaceae bacterium]